MRVLISLRLLSEIFFLLREINYDVIIHVLICSFKIPVILFKF
jgi:hypothetical protein